jgi:hypothetical protein
VEKSPAIVDYKYLSFKLLIQIRVATPACVAAVTFFTGTLCKNRYSEITLQHGPFTKRGHFPLWPLIHSSAADDAWQRKI